MATRYDNTSSDIISGTGESEALYSWAEISSGALQFDVNGRVSIAAVQFVYLSPGFAMTNKDLFISA